MLRQYTSETSYAVTLNKPRLIHRLPNLGKIFNITVGVISYGIICELTPQIFVINNKYSFIMTSVKPQMKYNGNHRY